MKPRKIKPAKKEKTNLVLYYGILFLVLGSIFFIIHFSNQSWINAIPGFPAPLFASIVIFVMGLIFILTWIKYKLTGKNYF